MRFWAAGLSAQHLLVVPGGARQFGSAFHSCEQVIVLNNLSKGAEHNNIFASCAGQN